MYTDASNGTYATSALHDVPAGTQLVCDYSDYEWDCRDKDIGQCLCGSSRCRGGVFGFKFLPFEEALSRLGSAEPHCRTCFLDEHQDVVFSQSPVTIGVDLVSATTGPGWCVIATSDFLADEVVCLWQSFLFDSNAVRYIALGVPCAAGGGRLPRRTLVFDGDGIQRASVPHSHGRGNREFFGFNFQTAGGWNAEIQYLHNEDDFDDGQCICQIRSTRLILAGAMVMCPEPQHNHEIFA